MGQILLVYDEYLMRDVALKELLPNASGVANDPSGDGDANNSPPHPSAEVVARFLREAQVTGQLAHPSIVPVYELGRRENGTLYYTMKLVRGRPLSLAIAESKTLSDRLAFLAHYTDVCQAIAYAHSRNIIHRDLKPSNIMLGEFGEAVVIDWGLAKFLDKDESEEGVILPSIGGDVNEAADRELLETQAGTRLGTPFYMSPEQARGEIRALDRRTDVYSLGVVLYELLTGEIPTKGESDQEFFDNIVNAPPTPITDLEPDAPPELASICMRALSKDADKRYASAEELASEIERFQSGALVHAYTYKPSDIIQRFLRRHLVAVSVGAASVIFIVLLGIYSYMSIASERTIAQSALAQASLELAQNAIEKKRPNDANEALLRVPQQYRGWEWGHLKYLASENLMALHTDDGPVITGKFSPDGSYIATVAVDGARLFDGETGLQLLEFDRDDKNAGGLDFMPDGRHFLTGDTDGTVWLRDIETGLKVRRLAQLPTGQGVLRNFPSPDGRTVVSVWGKKVSTWGATVFVWDVKTGEHRLTLDHGGPLASLDWSPDGRSFATSCHTIILWDAETGKKIHTFPHHVFVTTSVVFLDDDLLATTGRDGAIRIWEIATETLLHEMKEPRAGRWVKLAYSAPTNRLFSAGLDRVVNMWDPLAGQFILTLATMPGTIDSIDINLAGTRLILGGRGFDYQVLPIADMQGWRVWPGHSDHVTQVTFSPDGRHMASVAGRWADVQDKRILLWDVATGRQIRSFSEGDAKIWCVEFSPDGNSLFEGGSRSQIRRWDIQTGTIVQQFKAHMSNVRELATSPDGLYLASGGFEGFELWDLEKETRLMELASVEIDDVDYSPTGEFIAHAHRIESGARVINVDRRAVEVVLNTGTTWSVEFSPDGKRLATGGDSAIVQLWDVQTWRLVQEFAGHNARIRSLAFTPDGERLASRGDDDTIRIWNIQSGREVLTLAAPPSKGATIAFSPDSRTLASGTEDGSVKLWPTFPWREEDYPGSPSLPVSERIELYKREFWREKSSQLKKYSADATK
jgi:WD40 repeat protein/serine/threonine protein kinase